MTQVFEPSPFSRFIHPLQSTVFPRSALPITLYCEPTLIERFPGPGSTVIKLSKSAQLVLGLVNIPAISYFAPLSLDLTEREELKAPLFCRQTLFSDLASKAVNAVKTIAAAGINLSNIKK
jgi:hypothetical protein